jgi:hypothetical protein
VGGEKEGEEEEGVERRRKRTAGAIIAYVGGRGDRGPRG